LYKEVTQKTVERSYTTQMKNSHARATEKKLRVTSTTADCALKIQGQEDSNTILQIRTNQITLSRVAGNPTVSFRDYDIK